MVTLGVFGYVPPLLPRYERLIHQFINTRTLTDHPRSIDQQPRGLVAANGVLKSIDGLPLGEFILYISRVGQFD